jgi:hypothetical protein
MNSPRCCQRKLNCGDDARQQKTWLRRVRGNVGLVLPAALLALMPKCPMCLAAYVALGTGFTMSGSSAHILLRTLAALCIGTLALCVTRRVINCRHKNQTFNLNPTPTRA